MNARAILLTSAVLFAGCARGPDPAATRAAAPAPEAAGPVLIELDVEAQRDAGLEIVDVARRAVPLSIHASGRLVTNENTTWRVGAITDGRIIRVEARVGDRVEKGQILARMHSHDIHESRAEYRRAVAESNRIRANLDFAMRTRDRMRRLFEMKAASFEQLDQAENTVRNEQTALRNVEIELNRTRLHLVEFLQIPVEGPEEHGHSADPEAHIDDLIPVRAPESGIVLTREITPGAVVSAASDLFVICDLSTIWAMAAVQEEHLARLRNGMAARVHVQAYPGRAFAGRVGRIGEQLHPETRTVSVRVEIDNRGGLLKPEMYAAVELDAGGSEPGLFVPQPAVQDINGQSTVFVQRRDNAFEPRPVETGRALDGLLEVRRGLSAGERVAAHGSFILKAQMLKASLAED